MTSTAPGAASFTNSTIPVLLLKTKSQPTDVYEEYFSTVAEGRFRPQFIPVLEHKFNASALKDLRKLIRNYGVSPGYVGARYGGVIFTSQRAVEAFSKLVNDIRQDGLPVDDLVPNHLPLYVVGPATARGLRALDLKCSILGEETGTGEALAKFMLEHYNKTPSWEGRKLPLLFMVGEQRRDIIPNTLQSIELSEEQRIGVDEVVVYETGVMESFHKDFKDIWDKNVAGGVNSQWVVVFSPTGCKAMLEQIDLLDAETGKVKSQVKDEERQKRTTLIATIGPTTRDYLIKEFDFSPDICAPKPSPEGVGGSILEYMGLQGSDR